MLYIIEGSIKVAMGMHTGSDYLEIPASTKIPNFVFFHLHFNSLTADELAAGDEAVKHQSHLAASVDNNAVAFPAHLFKSNIGYGHNSWPRMV
jgi:hypothetical protein